MKTRLDRPLRPDHLDTGQPYACDMNALGAELLNEVADAQSGRTAATLIDHPGMKLVLTAMKAGASLAEHQAKGPITICCISGEMVFSTGPNSVSLNPGQTLTLPPDVRHSVTAKTDCAFLIIMAVSGPSH